MSATIRFDISTDAAAVIDAAALQPDPLKPFQAMGVRRMRLGAPRRLYQAVTFAIRLPAQLAETWRLLQLLRGLCACNSRYLGDWVVKDIKASTESLAQCNVLRRKLMTCLGLSADLVCLKEEQLFLELIVAEPASLDNWRVYADWLQDRDVAGSQLRGAVMAGWLHPTKAQKIRRGVPVINGRALKY